MTPEISHWKVKNDAQTGEILEKMNLVKEAAETGKEKVYLAIQKISISIVLTVDLA